MGLEIVGSSGIVPHQLFVISGRGTHDTKLTVAMECSGEAVVQDTVGLEFKVVVRLKEGWNKIAITCSSRCCKVSLELLCQTPKCNQHVKLVYITDEENVENYAGSKDKIALSGLILQSFVAHEMKERFGEWKTFRLETDQDLKPLCHLLRVELGKWKAECCRPRDLYWKLVGEILNSELFDENAKFLVFLKAEGVAMAKGQVAVVDANWTKYWPNHYSQIQGLFSSPTLLDHPLKFTCLDSAAGTNTTLGAYFATSLGAALHELSHTFDLIHDRRGIMGRGFENIHVPFLLQPANVATDKSGNGQVLDWHYDDSSSIILFYHPWLNGSKSNVGNPAFSPHRKTVISKSGMILIELRTEDSDTRITSWDLRLYPPTIWTVPEEIRSMLLNRKLRLGILTSDGIMHQL